MRVTDACDLTNVFVCPDEATSLHGEMIQVVLTINFGQTAA
jgi:hypothetical protein